MSNTSKSSLTTNNIKGSKNDQNFENHVKTSEHLEKAAKHHKEAAKYHKEGNFEKANTSTIKAQGHVCCATDLQREDVKNHAKQD